MNCVALANAEHVYILFKGTFRSCAAFAESVEEQRQGTDTLLSGCVTQHHAADSLPDVEIQPSL